MPQSPEGTALQTAPGRLAGPPHFGPAGPKPYWHSKPPVGFCQHISQRNGIDAHDCRVCSYASTGGSAAKRNTALRKEIDELKLKLATEQANQERLASLALSSAEATAQQGHITRMQMKARLEALQRHIALLPAAITRKKENILEQLYLEHHGAPAGVSPGPALPPLPPVTEQQAPHASFGGGNPAGVQAIMDLLRVEMVGAGAVMYDD